MDRRFAPPPSLAPRLAAFYFAYFTYAGVVVAYLPLYLAARGLHAGEIAFLVALPSIARVFAPAAWGWLADRTGASRGIVVLACVASAVAYAALPRMEGAASMAWLIGAMSLLAVGAVPLVEAITLGSLAGRTERYGPIRVWGSIGFIAAMLGGGLWLDYWPASTLPGVLVALLLVSLAAALALPRGSRRIGTGSSAPIGRGAADLLAAGFCMSVSHGALYAFYTLHLERLGYSGVLIGALWTLGVLAEIVVFLFLPALFRRHALSTILLASLACAVVRFVAIGWASTELWILVGAQLLHAATFGAFHAASVAAVYRVFPESAQTSGQALFSSIAYGAGTAAGALLAGLVWDAGPGIAFSSCAAAAVVGAYFAYRLKRFGL